MFMMALDLVPLVPMVAILVSIFLAIVYALSKLFQNSSFDVWFKTELSEFIVSIIIISLATSLVAAGPEFVELITGSTDFFADSLGTVDSWNNAYFTSYVQVISAAQNLGYLGSINVGLSISYWYLILGGGFSPTPGFSIFLLSMSKLSSSLATLLFLFEGLRALLVFIFVTAPTVLIPAGFILRLVPFTRKGGTALISVSLAAYLFLPTGILITEQFNSLLGAERPRPPEWSKITSATEILLNALPGDAICRNPVFELLKLNETVSSFIVCLPWVFWPISYAVCIKIWLTYIYPLIMLVTELLSWLVFAGAFFESLYYLSAPQGGIFFSGRISDYVYDFSAEITRLIVLGYVDLILVALIVIVGARSLSVALGGDWYLAGVQRVI